MRKFILLALMFCFISSTVFGKETYTLSGKVKNAKTGEELIRATISIPEQKVGIYSNTYGFYSLSVSPGIYTVHVSYVGFKTIERKIDLTKNRVVNFELEPSRSNTDTIEVVAQRRDIALTETVAGLEQVNIERFEKVPILLGEKDIMKTVQLLPGVSTTSEGSTGFSVRGGSTDQNLVVLDEATVYSPSHLMGFVSIFNSDAIKDLTLYKGGIPPQFGGRASSVMDVRMNNGNMKEYDFKGGIGLLSSRFTAEGPIIKDKMSFIVSGRRSYMDIMAKAIAPLISDNSMIDDAQFYYYDLNAKVNYDINQNNRLFLSGYTGSDVFSFKDMGNKWGNQTFTLRWNHIFSPKLFSNTTLLYSKYQYGFDLDDDITMETGINDISFKEDFTYFLNPKNTIKFGLSSIHHEFQPGELRSGEEFGNFSLIMEKQKSLESGLYIGNEQKITENFSMDYGLRFSLYNQLGNNSMVYEYDQDNERTDSTYYKNRSIVETFANIEPRVAMNYRLNETTSLKLSYNRISQYMHKLQNSTTESPVDYWLSSSNNINPSDVHQLSGGIFKNFFDNEIETSIEVYYKDMSNITDYENGADIMFNANVEAQVLQGNGRSYGAEFYIKKRFGLFTGWISYSIGRTEQKVGLINDNTWYPARHDKLHDIAIVASYDFTDRLSASATFIYYTGNAVTFPSGKYIIDGEVMPYYTERNGYRMPDYHRLDIGLRWKGKNKGRFHHDWEFSVYNAYNRYNAYAIYFQEKEDNPGVTEAIKVTAFGLIPSITWNFNF